MHQVGDQTEVVLRCTVNQPSRFVNVVLANVGHWQISVCESQQETPIITNPNKARSVQNFTQISDSLMYLRHKMQLKDIIMYLHFFVRSVCFLTVHSCIFSKLMFLNFTALQLEISQFSSVSYVLQHVDARLTSEYTYKSYTLQTNL